MLKNYDSVFLRKPVGPRTWNRFWIFLVYPTLFLSPFRPPPSSPCLPRAYLILVERRPRAKCVELLPRANDELTVSRRKSRRGAAVIVPGGMYVHARIPYVYTHGEKCAVTSNKVPLSRTSPWTSSSFSLDSGVERRWYRCCSPPPVSSASSSLPITVLHRQRTMDWSASRLPSEFPCCPSDSPPGPGTIDIDILYDFDQRSWTVRRHKRAVARDSNGFDESPSNISRNYSRRENNALQFRAIIIIHNISFFFSLRRYLCHT